MAEELRLQTLTIQRQLNLITETCSNCGALFAMEAKLQQERLADKQRFYCPNGHSMSYMGKTEAQKLREQIEEERRLRQRAEQKVAEKHDEAQAAWNTASKERERAEHERRRANGYKGHATRITKRAKAGVCPCCNRTFKQLAAHMANKHPQFTPMPLEVIEGGKAAANA